MGDFKIKYYNEQDGCTYCWDKKIGKWVKVCVVEVLPDVVAQRVQNDIENAKELLSIGAYK